MSETSTAGSTTAESRRDRSPNDRADARGHEVPGPSRRRILLAVASVLVPLGAWVLSLAGSYILQDFTCLSYASAGASAPEAALRWALVGLNVVLLAVTLAAGAAGWWALRHADDGPRPRLLRFLGLVGAATALMMAFSVVLIGFQPLLLAVC